MASNVFGSNSEKGINENETFNEDGQRQDGIDEDGGKSYEGVQYDKLFNDHNKSSPWAGKRADNTVSNR